jgi:hypothetical protein
MHFSLSYFVSISISFDQKLLNKMCLFISSQFIFVLFDMFILRELTQNCSFSFG